MEGSPGPTGSSCARAQPLLPCALSPCALPGRRQRLLLLGWGLGGLGPRQVCSAVFIDLGILCSRESRGQEVEPRHSSSQEAPLCYLCHAGPSKQGSCGTLSLLLEATAGPCSTEAGSQRAS